jgi:hypothetical protein
MFDMRKYVERFLMLNFDYIPNTYLIQCWCIILLIFTEISLICHLEILYVKFYIILNILYFYKFFILQLVI